MYTRISISFFVLCPIPNSLTHCTNNNLFHISLCFENMLLSLSFSVVANFSLSLNFFWFICTAADESFSSFFLYLALYNNYIHIFIEILHKTADIETITESRKITPNKMKHETKKRIKGIAYTKKFIVFYLNSFFFKLLRRGTQIVYPRVQLESLEHSLSTYKRGTYTHTHTKTLKHEHIRIHARFNRSLAHSLYLAFKQHFCGHTYTTGKNVQFNPSLLLSIVAFTTQTYTCIQTCHTFATKQRNICSCVRVLSMLNATNMKIFL